LMVFQFSSYVPQARSIFYSSDTAPVYLNL
jgi:hypothetical protein